ncbi:MAG: hypothetical protein QOG13_982 [Sphingomonadales bacterium]|nr:hypothetical protein [Sphingomonadales bacterium]MEA3044108.1 hypothetical protein [Sphingomonadales bacterium]
MNWKPIVIAAAAAAGLAAPAPAWAQGAYSLRNNAGRSLPCRLQRPHSAAADRFTLRDGEEWRRPAQSAAPRRLVCDTGADPLWAVLRPGPRYVLVLDPGSRRIVVRIAPAD